MEGQLCNTTSQDQTVEFRCKWLNNYIGMEHKYTTKLKKNFEAPIKEYSQVLKDSLKPITTNIISHPLPDNCRFVVVVLICIYL